MFELLRGCPNGAAFTAAIAKMRVADVLDLIWVSESPLELHDVQAVLEDLASRMNPVLLPGFSAYDEPRYRAALQMRFERIPQRAAVAGILSRRPGQPAPAETAHVRLFLAAWQLAALPEAKQ